MPAKAIRVKGIASIIVTGGVAAENILSFREDHVHNMTPQFVPNVYKGVDVLQRAKFRRLTVVFDSDTNIFDAYWKVAAINVVMPATLVVTFDMAIADGVETTMTWTYVANKSWVTKKEFGRIEDEVKRSTFEYEIICYGTKVPA